jgi:hypothetical protein
LEQKTGKNLKIPLPKPNWTWLAIGLIVGIIFKDKLPEPIKQLLGIKTKPEK